MFKNLKYDRKECNSENNYIVYIMLQTKLFCFNLILWYCTYPSLIRTSSGVWIDLLLTQNSLVLLNLK